MPFAINQSYTTFQIWYQEYQKNPLAQASASFVGACFLILGLFFFAIRPSMVTIATLKDQIEELETLNRQLSSKALTLSKLYPQYQQLQPVAAKINQAVPSQHEFQVYEQQIRFLILSHDLAMKSLAFSGFSLKEETQPLAEPSGSPVIDETSGLPILTLSLSVEGEYTKMKAFLGALQKLIRITHIQQTDIDAGKTSEANNLTVSLRGNAYIFDESSLALQE